MPFKPRRHCAYPGCPNFVDEGAVDSLDKNNKGRLRFSNRGRSTFCELHKKIAEKNYETFERKYDHKERYGHDWDKLRNKYISTHPLCEECLKENKSTIARVVHHKVPIEDGGAILDIDNLMSVCDSCHQKIHNRLKDNKRVD